MDVIIDEAALSVYANRAEQYAVFLGTCIDRYAAAVRGVLGPGCGLHDETVEVRLLHMAGEAEQIRDAAVSAAESAGAQVRSLIAEAAEADRFVWRDMGFTEAGAVLAGC